jgi:sulfite exporter TauE/SafE
MNDLGILAALLAGLLGSGHCVAMCGAMAAGPSLAGAAGPPRDWREALLRRLQYNAGRIAVYGIAGALAGLVGAVAGDSLQRIVDVLGGALPAGALVRFLAAAMVIMVGLRVMCQWAWLRWPERIGGYLFSRVAPRLTMWLGASGGGAGTGTVGPMASGVGTAVPSRPDTSEARHEALRRVALGAIWGWLPCGLSYTMLLVALVSGSALRGAAVMLAFGLGTLPALLGVGMLATTWRRLRSPVAVTAGGWLLVVFGTFAVSATGETLVTALTAANAAPVQFDAHDGLIITDAYCGIPAVSTPR